MIRDTLTHNYEVVEASTADVTVSQSGLTHNYEVVDPQTGDITGYRPGNYMEMARLLTGTDLGYNSRWTVKRMNGTVDVHPLNAPSIWSKRTMTLKRVRTHFKPRMRQ